MKSLKITVLAIFSIALLMGVNNSNETEPTSENHEVRKAEVKLTAFTERKKNSVPQQG